ncbi:MAG: hypothetical protein ACR2P1_05280 [Pseudomonadales bacterium]
MAIVLWIGYEAVVRFLEPVEILGKTMLVVATLANISENVVSLHDYRWGSHASELYHLPIAA